MILTNVLLSIGFSIVSNFSATVALPPDLVPAHVEDLKKYIVGSYFWPADLCLVNNRGAAFKIEHGVVRYFVSPNSFTGNDDPKLIPQFRGTPTLSSNQVVELAEKTVRRLARRGDPIAALHPRVVHLRESSKGPNVPFYEISWPDPEREGNSPAWIEIDARTGQVVKVHLLDYSFYDLAFAWEIRKRVCIPDPVDSAQRVVENRVMHHQDRPSTNQVVEALSSWLWFWSSLGMHPGGCTNLGAVDWNATSIYTNPWITATTVVCRVTFTNGSWFDSVAGTVISSFSADSCYIDQWWARSPEEWFLFEGKIGYRWDDLAANLERNLVEKLGVPKESLAALGRQLRNTKAPQVGTTGLKRVLVNWTNGQPQRVEYRNGAAWFWENHLGFDAEFDVETGELEFMYFRDPKLIEALGKAQSRAKQNSHQLIRIGQ